MCAVGFTLYALLNVLAMVFFPGGTSNDKGRTGYSFSENFFSDLGMVRTHSGESNALSASLFASALVLIGAALIVFFILLPGYFTSSKPEKCSSRIGSAAGIIAGLSCIGIAAAPWDLYPATHLGFTYCLSGTFLLAMSSYAIAILKNRSYPNLYALYFGMYLLVLTAYVILMLFGPGIETPAGLRVMAGGQKAVIYSGMLCLFAQVLGAFFYNRAGSARQCRESRSPKMTSKPQPNPSPELHRPWGSEGRMRTDAPRDRD